MKKTTISRDDAETIMIALDQVSQTIDVMNMIVGRLKQRMHHALDKPPHTENREAASGDRRTGPAEISDVLKNDQLH